MSRIRTQFDGPSQASLAMLQALQSRPMYQGTVTAAAVERRHAANRAAKAARRTHRRSTK